MAEADLGNPYPQPSRKINLSRQAEESFPDYNPQRGMVINVI